MLCFTYCFTSCSIFDDDDDGDNDNDNNVGGDDDDIGVVPADFRSSNKSL